MGIGFGDDENILELDRVIIAQLCDYTKNYWMIHFKK